MYLCICMDFLQCIRIYSNPRLLAILYKLLCVTHFTKTAVTYFPFRAPVSLSASRPVRFRSPVPLAGIMQTRRRPAETEEAQPTLTSPETIEAGYGV